MGAVPGEWPEAREGREPPFDTSRFQIVRKLGAGGMGVVFEAVDRLRGTRVALKVLRRLGPEALLRFKTEFRALADLQHPNLVRLDELISDGRHWCFTMEPVDGVDFLEHVRVPGRPPEAAGLATGTLDEREARSRRGTDAHPAAAGSAAPTPPAGLAAAGDGSGAPTGSDAPGAPGAPDDADGAPDDADGDETRVERGPALARAAARRARAAPLGGGFDEARLRGAVAQLVEGLGALHAAGKVHRDVKPSNILVTPAGRVVLLDFGVIADLRRGSDGQVAGTPRYMAPEQADGRGVGPPADWYAVGLLLYEALAGRLPFGGSAWESLELRRRVAPPPPSSLAPDVPEDLDRLCTDLLRIEPGERPDEAEVRRRLALGAGAGAALRGRFVGRRRELAELEAWFAAARAGGAEHAAVILGESGAGKTALADRLLARLDPEVVVLAGRCCERESVPYKAVDDVVDDLSRYLKRLPPEDAAALWPERAAPLAQLFPVLQRTPLVAAAVAAAHEPHGPADGPELLDPHEVRLRAFAALRELLARVARRHPLLLSIDDVQWADADSLALLAYVFAPPAPPGVLLLGTARPPAGAASAAEATAAGDAALALAGTRRIALAGLPPDEARELAEALLAPEVAAPAERRQLAAEIAAESGGHPLFIDELVRRRREPGAHPAPPRLDDALAARIDALASEERAVLELAAIAGAPIAREVAAAATGLALDELAPRLASLRAVNLLRSATTAAGPGIEPYHDRVRRAALAGLAPAVQRALHGRLAALLEARGADAETLAAHYHEAGEAQRAAAWAALAAARAADALAFDRAARLYRMAVAHEPAHTTEGRRLRIGLAEALVNAGHGAAAARVFEEAAAAAVSVDDALAADLQRRAAEQYLRNGHMDAGFAATAGALSSLGLGLPRTPRRALASLVVRRGALRLRGLGYRERAAAELPAATLHRIDACYSVATSIGFVDHVLGAAFQTRNLMWALDAGEPYRLARALAMEAGYIGAAGPRARPRAERVLDEARALARRIDHPHALGLVEAFGGMVAFAAGDWRGARTRLEGAGATLRERCHGVAWELATIDFVALWAVIYEGELGELALRVPPLLRAAEERGDRHAVTNLRTSFVPVLHLAADRPAEARREAEEAVRAWSRDGFHLQHYNAGIFAEGEIGLYLGEAAAAHARIAARWPALRASMLAMIQQLRIEALHVRARCALAAAAAAPAGARPGARAAWLRAAEADLRRIARTRASWARGWIDLLAAGIAAVRGDAEAAAARARAAAEGCDRAGLALYAAAARGGLGALLGGDEGRRLIADADARFAREGVRDPRRLAACLAPGLAGG